ncbi:cobalt ECF transporter T component CbiQ [Streptomyces yaizuensis]|uniref:Cobalt ECF transporter T component CbiQ n=1 Tax=Streptomyces yaizuensis TaxID=2989713 RepID=A0ABQ5PA81_9ACTN|nr:cobalt ECF transporter T component CbiQ [Streptomyces sp. YSPA8]GLF99461.1 cobalt ECF transporter T component CbiQ [Streptomyces sp. YSPA8]
MGAGHAHRLHHPGDSPVHTLPAHTKLVAVLCFVLAVAATPREAMWAFGAYALLVAAAVAHARLPARLVLRRLLVETPFVLFAVLLPLTVPGPTTAVAGLQLSVPGLWGAWNILAKGTLGVAAAVVLAATTGPTALLLGLQRLRLPPQLVQIAAFMIRYADVVADEMRRMSVARRSRGFEARGPAHWRTLATSAGALFIRSYERGERVHLAMVSRGGTGVLPHLAETTVSRARWGYALALPSAAFALCLTAWTTR